MPFKAVQELDVDQILPHVGEYGRFQIMLQSMLCVAMIPQTLQILLMYFAAYNPPWRCVFNSTDCPMNGTFSSSSKQYDFRCSIPRSEWEYKQPKDFSIVTQVNIFSNYACINHYFCLNCEKLISLKLIKWNNFSVY